MSADYPSASLPEPYQILGARLRALSLGHVILMLRFDCAFMTGAPPRLADLVMGVTICRHTWSEFVEFLSDPAGIKEMRAWGKLCGEFDFLEKAALFERYLETGAKQPVVMFEGEPSKSGAHWTQTLKVALIDLGYSPEQALDMPLSQAFADFYAKAEASGAVKILSAAQAAALEAGA